MEQEYIPKIDDEPSLDPGDVVKFTQRARFQAFNELTDNGQNISKNLGDTMQLLRDLDAAALTTRKLNIEEKTVHDGRQARESFSKLVQMFGDNQPYERPAVEGEVAPPPRRRSPLPENHVIPPVKLNPGEDAQGEQVLSIANYISAEE